MFRLAFVFSVFAVSIATEVERGERLLLHSDVDTATAIQMLISQVDHLNAQYGQLSAENAQLRTDVEQLKASKTKGEYFTHLKCPCAKLKSYLDSFLN